MKKHHFRSLEKEGIEFQVPLKIAILVRERTRGRRSLSMVGTEMLARGLGLDPEEFGIEPLTPSLDKLR